MHAEPLIEVVLEEDHLVMRWKEEDSRVDSLPHKNNAVVSSF
jgi:hypothetical protein